MKLQKVLDGRRGGGLDIGAGWSVNPLSEKLSENGMAYTGFFIFLPTYSRKYSLSEITILQ